MPRRPIRALTVLLLAWLAVAPRAQAFSVAVHVYLANSIHDELARSMARDGRPVIRLMGPDGRVVSVEIDPRDAEAILENPEFFRGGAIGPDNTVLTGLTDPSHAWQFQPFAQCATLLAEAMAEEQRALDAGAAFEDVPLEERAYALGCFLHGITDNTAHHAVNLFTNETFTLYPIDAASGDMLGFSLLNVARHIATETRFQNGLEAQDATLSASDRERPGVMAAPLTAGDLQHRIATDLVGRVYFDQGDAGPNALWDDFASDLVDGKRAALRAGLGLGPTDDIVLALSSSTDPWTDDQTAVTSYVGYLRDGGLAPPDYILMLPEIVRDVDRLYAIVNVQGVRRAQTISSAFFVRKRLLENAFAPRDASDNVNWDAFGPSRFEDVMATKQGELLTVVPAYLQTVENISNLNMTVGILNSTREQRLAALQPLIDAINAITNINYNILFSATTNEILDNVQFIQDAIQGILDLVTMRVREFVIDRVLEYLDTLELDAAALRAEVLAYLDTVTGNVYGDLRARVREAAADELDERRRVALERLGVDLEDNPDFFERFLTSAAYMNAYNSVGGVLADPEVVVVPASGMFAGPVSFDASYQLEYNQLALCPDNRAAFYPCGTSAGEMLQPDYRRCVALPELGGALEPPVECHDGSSVTFSGAISEVSCAPVDLDVFLADPNPSGSYTLAFPPSMTALGAAAPVCRLSVPVTVEEGPPLPGADGGLSGDGGVGPDGSVTPPGAGDGCSCRAAPSGSRGGAWLALGWLALGWLALRRHALRRHALRRNVALGARRRRRA